MTGRNLLRFFLSLLAAALAPAAMIWLLLGLGILLSTDHQPSPASVVNALVLSGASAFLTVIVVAPAFATLAGLRWLNARAALLVGVVEGMIMVLITAWGNSMNGGVFVIDWRMALVVEVFTLASTFAGWWVWNRLAPPLRHAADNF